MLRQRIEALLIAIGAALMLAACASGGGDPPSPTPTPQATATAARTPPPQGTTVAPQPSPTPGSTVTPTRAPTPTLAPTATGRPVPTATATATQRPTPTPTRPPLRGQALLDQQRAYPHATLFRAVLERLARTPGNESLEQALAIAANYDMVIAKGLDEEVIGLQAVGPYLRAVKSRYPEKIVLDHFLFEGRNPDGSQPAVFPGHWLLMNGTTLAANVSAAATILPVADSSLFLPGEAAQMTALGADGKPDYSRVEQVRIVAVTPGQVQVTRGAHGSTAQEFRAGQTRLAAHAYVRYSNEVWKYNFCLEGPRDAQGRRLIEALAQTLAGYLRPGGALEGIDGYQFDVSRFTAASTVQGPNRRLDCDNDGAADAGYSNNASSYGLGAVTFMQTLRSLVGESVFLISEATGDTSNRDTEFANGIENESFPDLHQWDEISAPLQRYFYWLQEARAPRLSYLQLKEFTEAFTRCPEEEKGTNWKIRLALGAALLGNGYFAYIPVNPEVERDQCAYVDPATRLNYAEPDEFKAGRENRWGYLGRPVEEPRRLDRLTNAPNLLASGDFERDTSGATLTQLGQSRATLSRDAAKAGSGSGSLKVSITQLDRDPADSKISVSIGTFAVRKDREYTLRVKVAADPKYGARDAAYGRIPRRIAFGIATPSVAGSRPATQDVMADGAWRDYSLTFIVRSDEARATLVMELGREAGDVWLDDARLMEGPGDIFARRFERGVVLVNASLQAVTFELRALFPGIALRRIAGTQDAAVNSGAPAGDAVSVPGRDALILVTG
ncbi:MAG: hypothetical protein FJ039_02225 [Chloroflexi bacterium]|nr:hypothetical protein [Chloroflexota bacterium]